MPQPDAGGVLSTLPTQSTETGERTPHDAIRNAHRWSTTGSTGRRRAGGFALAAAETIFSIT
ncbi:MAG TPA: hypothetical protein PLT86_13480, partial [Candidatus Latescibacteria bacterium]|nr:hypothetical protein [Candidatus Latescibacterota bacterium]